VHAARYLGFGEYILLKLAGEVRCSVSSASATGLYDQARRAWDEPTLDLLGIDAASLPPVSDEPVHDVWPAVGDGACSNLGTGCVGRNRVAVTLGTSGAARVVYGGDAADARPGLFLYRVDGERLCEGGALSDGGNLHAWLHATLRDLDTGGIAEREPAAHGLVFLPMLGGERSLGWDAKLRGTVEGLSFATTPLDIAQAALEAVCYRFAAVLDALGQIESVVVTGGALLSNPDWVQVLADVLGYPVEVSGAAEGSARGAAVLALERLGLPVPEAPIERTVEPRLDRHAAHVAGRAEQERLLSLLRER
jgi:gluconokinase